jgi:hypothetical protein
MLELSILLGRYPRPETAMRESVLDEKLLQVDSSREDNFSSDSQQQGNQKEGREARSGIKRICYFTSKADENTPWKDVVSHAQEAKRRGWDVEVHVWEDSAHCNHLGKHEDEYKDAVWRMWMPVKARL